MRIDGERYANDMDIFYDSINMIGSNNDLCWNYSIIQFQIINITVII
jgi:hypothetical protein